jgi:sphinganine C4-monooxygenase
MDVFDYHGLGNIHSVHHYNYIPYSFAAAYNHPVEGFFNDIVGFFLSALFVGLSDRESTVFYTIATIKTVDDHAGFALPYIPFHLWGWLFGNGMVYHNIHHQAWGLKVSFESLPRRDHALD